MVRWSLARGPKVRASIIVDSSLCCAALGVESMGLSVCACVVPCCFRILSRRSFVVHGGKHCHRLSGFKSVGYLR